MTGFDAESSGWRAVKRKRYAVRSASLRRSKLVICPTPYWTTGWRRRERLRSRAPGGRFKAELPVNSATGAETAGGVI